MTNSLLKKDVQKRHFDPAIQIIFKFSISFYCILPTNG
jgi:hypothetical protein